jgi:IS30 family transposase
MNEQLFLVNRNKFSYLIFEERKLIEKFIQQGKSDYEISLLLKRSQQCIYSEIRKNESPYSAVKAQESFINRNKLMRKKIHFTESQQKIILDSHYKGISTTEIANKIGCSQATIGRFLKKRRNNSVQELHLDLFDKEEKIPVPIESINYLKNQQEQEEENLRSNELCVLAGKVEILEMQIELLINEINKLRRK